MKTIDLDWLESAIERNIAITKKDLQAFVDASRSFSSSVEQLEVVKNNLCPFIDQQIEDARRAAGEEDGFQECVDILTNALSEIRNFLDVQPLIVSKELERLELGSQAAVDKTDILSQIRNGARERSSYLADLEQRIENGEVEVAPTPGKRRKERKVGTRPDKVKDVRNVAKKLQKNI